VASDKPSRASHPGEVSVTSWGACAILGIVCVICGRREPKTKN
jgi:hypothetical protein